MPLPSLSVVDACTPRTGIASMRSGAPPGKRRLHATHHCTRADGRPQLQGFGLDGGYVAGLRRCAAGVKSLPTFCRRSCMSKYPVKLAERNRRHPVAKTKSGAVEVRGDAVEAVAPTLGSSSFLSFRYSYTELSVLGGK